MTYRAAPVTQRDGSPLASSNCRMASIATGLDFHTLGAERSTGAAMRAAQDDQSGGTGSDDAKVAWSRGYGETLRVMDGNPWSSALADLRAGRLVHLDVWHATAGGPCLSGSGGYGHTMAVAPEQNDAGSWLVADPWCSPAKWVWWPESKLKAGAEEWGGRVLRSTTGGQWPPRGTPAWYRMLAVVARRLMTERHPGNVDTLPPADPDTGGSTTILYTTTKPQAGGAAMPRFVKAEYHLVADGGPKYGLEMVDGDKWTYLDGSTGGTFSAPMLVEVYGLIDGEPNAYIVLVQSSLPYDDGQKRDTLLMVSTTRDKITLPVTPGGDGDTAARDAEWQNALRGGKPWPTEPTE